MVCKRYIIYRLNLFISPADTKFRGVCGPAHYGTGGLCCYCGTYICYSSFGTAFFIGADCTDTCCGTAPCSSFFCPYRGSITVAVAKCRNFSSAQFFSAHATLTSGMFTGFCTSGRSLIFTYPCMSCIDVFCCSCSTVTATGKSFSSAFCTFPIMAQSSELSRLNSSGHCCICIRKHTGASAAGPVAFGTFISTGCCLSCCFGQAMTQLFNGKYFADCAGSVAYQIHYPRLFRVGRNCSNVFCISVCSTGRSIIAFCLLDSNYSYLVSLMTNVFT